MHRKGKVVVSFHDLAPHSQGACEFLLELARSFGICRISLLVVPWWHEGQRITDSPSFVSWLKHLAGEGHEICLHGFLHSGPTDKKSVFSWFLTSMYTDNEAEFYRIGEQEALRRVNGGLEQLNEIGVPVYGFVAPAWLLDVAGYNVIKRKGFGYTTTLNHVELLKEGRRIYAPTLALSTRSSWRRILSRMWASLWLFYSRKAFIVRLAVHPSDLSFPSTRRILSSSMRKVANNRLACTYRDLLCPHALKNPVVPYHTA
ncbi:MAG: polysaccharide deacetylase family protein [Deltaproteobacteria bacterium]|nr:polysaccharide deacetylase family protein [Deltaproteobacteria bacterium]